jgi:hypothetical protein
MLVNVAIAKVTNPVNTVIPIVNNPWKLAAIVCTDIADAVPMLVNDAIAKVTKPVKAVMPIVSIPWKLAATV